MGKTAKELVTQAEKWLGKKESNGTHKEIIDVYNSHKPLARGYKMKYTDAWCACFVSACAIKTKMTNIIPTEVGCGKMKDLFVKKGIWIEDESVTPKVGDIVFYDWEDSGKGDNKGGINHVGICDSVNTSKKTFTVIEGNYSNAVKRRTLKFNGKYLRGFGRPKYEVEAETKPATKPTTTKKVEGAKKFNPLYAFGKTFKVNSKDGLYLRYGPRVSDEVIGLMTNGTKVKWYGYYTDKWYLVKVASGDLKGKTGYCSKNLLK